MLDFLKAGLAAKREQAKALLTSADAARDARNWSEAASLYTQFLKLRPKTFGILVQQGHCLKEAGDLAGATASYARALKINPKDADLLLNFGHLDKRRDDLQAAARHYAASYRADGNTWAFRELSSAFLRRFLNDDERKLIEEVRGLLAKQVGKLVPGLPVTQVNDIVVEPDDTLLFTSGDPWIEFDLTKMDFDGARVAALTAKVEALDGSDLHNVIYLDYGDGYSQRNHFQLTTGDDGQEVQILLLCPSKIRRLRWDPDMELNHVRLHSLRIEPLHGRAAVEDHIRRNAPADADLSVPLRTAATVMDGPAPEGDDILKYMRRMMAAGVDLSFDYEYWIDKYITPEPEDYTRIRQMTDALAYKPKFSFVMPVYNTPPELLRECLDSLLGQTYADLEICIADDRSPNAEVREVLEEYMEKDDRVKVAFRERNGHISAASNSALALATGDYIVLVDHDDLVPDYCLFVVAYYINRNNKPAILYSDEDKVDLFGNYSTPYFKGDFNQFLLYGHNMISHLGVYRRDLLNDIGGFRLGLEGSQDYDLFIRSLERLTPDDIVHIPHVLYHWRMLPGSTSVSADQKSYAIFAAQGAINGYFERQNIPLRSIDGFAPGCTGIAPTREYTTRLSIIIPTRNGLDVLQPCIESILARDHSNTEILIVDNGSDDPATLAYFKKIVAHEGVRVLSWPQPFNFSAINNFAAEQATGEILCFLNNDTEVIGASWLQRARALLAMPEIGMVGARLLFPDGSLQHFGITIGTGEHGIATTPHGGYPGAEPGYFGKARLIQEFSAVTAACMFVRKADFDTIGGFDPELRIAYNDIDLCLRFREAGLKILADPEILLIHKESKTRGSDKSGDKAARLEAEADMMRTRWRTVLAKGDPYWSPNLSIKRADFALAYPPRVRLPWIEATADGAGAPAAR